MRRFREFSGGQICWHEYRSRDEIVEFHRLASELSKKTWQEKLVSFGLPQTAEFREEISGLAQRGRARGYILFHGHRPIAYVFASAPLEEVLELEFTGYDPDFRYFSPGTVLFYLLLERLFEEGKFRIFDLGVGEGPYKEWLGTNSVLCADLYYFRRTGRNLSIVAAHSLLHFTSLGLLAALDFLGLKVRIKRILRLKLYSLRTIWANLVRIIRNPILDLRYGQILRGGKHTPYREMGAFDTGNTDYAVLPTLFDNRVSESDVLVDVGCGKGRVINWWLGRGYRNKMVGIELDEEIAEQARRRLREYRNVTIITGDAVENIPEDGTLFYMYNPFDGPIVEKFKNRLAEMFYGRRDIVVVYYNCLFVHLFEQDPRWKIKLVDFEIPAAHRAAILELCKEGAGPEKGRSV